VTNETKIEDLKTDRDYPRSVSPFKAGLRCSCPSCGVSPLFKGLLDVRKRCGGCGFDLSQADPGDGAQVFVILILGALCAIVGSFLHAALGVPLWAVMVVLFAMIIGGSVWMLRIFKATLVALQFRHDASEGKLAGDDSDET